VELRDKLGVAEGAEWDRFPEDSIEGRLCRTAAERLRGIDEQIPGPLVTPEQIPASLGVRHMPKSATQEALGRLLTELERIRGLDALIYDLYNDSKMILVGTPSGITLSPEGGAHQSTITPSIGIELPTLIFYEPCFGREVEWVLLEALRQVGDRRHGRSTYLR